MFVFLGLVPLKLIFPCGVLEAVVRAEAGSSRHTEMRPLAKGVQVFCIRSGMNSVPGVGFPDQNELRTNEVRNDCVQQG